MEISTIQPPEELLNYKKVIGDNNFYIDWNVNYTEEWTIEMDANYYKLVPPPDFGVYFDGKIDTRPDRDHPYICFFDGVCPRAAWENYEYDEYDFISKYNLPDWIEIKYMLRYSRYSDYFNNKLISFRDVRPKTTKLGIPIYKLQKAELEANGNFDFDSYLNENLVKPTFKYFKELLDKIFNSNLLEDIVRTIKANTSQETEVFEDLSLKELFTKAYEDE